MAIPDRRRGTPDHAQLFSGFVDLLDLTSVKQCLENTLRRLTLAQCADVACVGLIANLARRVLDHSALHVPRVLPVFNPLLFRITHRTHMVSRVMEFQFSLAFQADAFRSRDDFCAAFSVCPTAFCSAPCASPSRLSLKSSSSIATW